MSSRDQPCGLGNNYSVGSDYGGTKLALRLQSRWPSAFKVILLLLLAPAYFV